MFNNKNQLPCSNNFSLEKKKKYIERCISSVAVGESETGTVGKCEERVIGAFVVLLFVDQKQGPQGNVKRGL